MNERSERTPGVIEGASRVLRQLLASRRARETSRILTTHLDPENADLIVDVLAEDPQRLMDALAVAPQVANSGAVAVAEAGRRLARVPRGLRRELAAQAIADLDTERLGTAVGTAVGLTAQLAGGTSGSVGAALSDRAEAFIRGYRGATAATNLDREVWARNAAARIRRFGAEHPAFVEEVARPLARALREVVDGEDEEVGDVR